MNLQNKDSERAVSFWSFSEQQIDELFLDEESKEILKEVGLPSKAPPWFTFTNKIRIFTDIYRSCDYRCDRYLVIGYTDTDDPLCIDTFDGDVVSLSTEHEEGLLETFYNSSFSQFLETICLMAETINSNFEIKFIRELSKFDYLACEKEHLIWEREYERLKFEHEYQIDEEITFNGMKMLWDEGEVTVLEVSMDVEIEIDDVISNPIQLVEKGANKDCLVGACFYDDDMEYSSISVISLGDLCLLLDHRESILCDILDLKLKEVQSSIKNIINYHDIEIKNSEIETYITVDIRDKIQKNIRQECFEKLVKFDLEDRKSAKFYELKRCELLKLFKNEVLNIDDEEYDDEYPEDEEIDKKPWTAEPEVLKNFNYLPSGKREKEVALAREHISDARLIAFFRVARLNDKRKFQLNVLAVKLINDELDAGFNLNQIFYTTEKNKKEDGFLFFEESGYLLSVDVISENTLYISFGCLAGPLVGDGGAWEVIFDGDKVISLEGGFGWVS